ncbi:DcrB-related protein [Sphingomonas parapaucimobilis]|uniref:DcrB-related protein n=1 Tax=Sphingomonas parapaucimobilis TaxID=28213 RepID=UPI0035C7D8A2
MTIDCPAGWQDQSMLVLSAGPGTLGVAPSFVVTREIAPSGLPTDRTERLDVFADRQAEQIRDTLPAPVELQRHRADIPGSALELRLDWISNGIPIRQWITDANAPDGSVMIATGTAVRADYDMVEPVFRAMLQTFHLT